MDQSIVDIYRRYWAEMNGLTLVEDDDRYREPHCPVCRRWWDHVDDVEEQDIPFLWHREPGCNPCWPCHEAIEAGGVKMLDWDLDNGCYDYVLVEPGPNFEAWSLWLNQTGYDIGWHTPDRWSNREAAERFNEDKEEKKRLFSINCESPTHGSSESGCFASIRHGTDGPFNWVYETNSDRYAFGRNFTFRGFVHRLCLLGWAVLINDDVNPEVDGLNAKEVLELVKDCEEVGCSDWQVHYVQSGHAMVYRNLEDDDRGSLKRWLSAITSSGLR